MSQYYSQLNNIEEGFQILIRATELASEFLKMAQEDRRLKLNFLLSSDVSCSEAEPSEYSRFLSTFERREEKGFLGRVNRVPVTKQENRVPERNAVVDHWKKQVLSSNKDVLSVQVHQEQLGELKTSSLTYRKPQVNRPSLRIAESNYSSFYIPSEEEASRNRSLEYRTGKQALVYVSELSSANSLLSLEGSARQTISRRGRRGRNSFLSDEQRRKLRTLRNREAAERARIRKRERERLLEEQLNRILDENRRLEKELLWLKEVRASSCL